jgi:putative ABC transport system ATP-binding protein
MGLVFQSFHPLDYLSVLENVMLPLVTSSLPSRLKMKLAREALERVGLQGKETRLPVEISGGEQERVAIARAIVNRPLLLLADEPTGNLDSATWEQVMELFGDLHSRGMTIVMVNHSEQWATTAQRTIKISDGRVIGNYHTGCSFESQFQNSRGA